MSTDPILTAMTRITRVCPDAVVSADPDGLHVRITSPVDFNALASIVAMPEPHRTSAGWVSRGSLGGVQVTVTLPAAVKAVL